jgi:hypothetical protein
MRLKEVSIGPLLAIIIGLPVFFTSKYPLLVLGQEVTWGLVLSLAFMGIVATYCMGRAWERASASQVTVSSEMEYDEKRKMYRLRLSKKAPGFSSPRVDVGSIYTTRGRAVEPNVFPVQLHFSHHQNKLQRDSETTVGVFEIRGESLKETCVVITGVGTIGLEEVKRRTLWMELHCYPDEYSSKSVHWFKVAPRSSIRKPYAVKGYPDAPDLIQLRNGNSKQRT